MSIRTTVVLRRLGTTLLVLLALAGLAEPVTAAPRYDWPVAAPRQVGRAFDPPSKPWLAGHRGVDLTAPPGTVVRSAGDGTVTYAGLVAGKPVVSIEHGQVRTTYEPVLATVVVGDQVTIGQQIGVLAEGHPECVAAACLHWGAKRGERYIDPLGLLGVRRVRLLPL